MKRRDFCKLSLATSSALLSPSLLNASNLKLEDINFSDAIYQQNKAQSIIIFLYGGASPLAGNLSNIDQIKENSQTNYDSYFRGITKTPNNFWQEAGGLALEDLVANNDISVFRTCFSKVREENNNKSHGPCTTQNQKGSFDENTNGILTNLAAILEHNNAITQDTIMPFVTLDGESTFYADQIPQLSPYHKPVSINEKLDNPYSRSNMRNWLFYTKEEKDSSDNYYKSDEDGGFDPALQKILDDLSLKNTKHKKIKEAFIQRGKLEKFIENIKSKTTPDLGENNYPAGDRFAKNLETAVKILAHNPDTKVVTIGGGGLGGWDDHSNAREYAIRSESLFIALRSAMAHIKALNKDGNINIMVMSEFGRNVNLNSAFGWDHGNLQTFYLLGGKNYFNHKGVVGETKLKVSGATNRLFLYPDDNSYSFEPMSIASTIYKIFGVTNPEVLSSGYNPIDI